MYQVDYKPQVTDSLMFVIFHFTVKVDGEMIN